MLAMLMIILAFGVYAGQVSGVDHYVSSGEIFTLTVNSASFGDRIIVTDSFSVDGCGNLRSGQQLTITTDGYDYKIKRGDGFMGSILNVPYTGNLTLTGNGSGTLTIDGMNPPDSSSLVSVNGGVFII